LLLTSLYKPLNRYILCIYAYYLAKKVPILGADQQIYRFNPHEFRHIVGTSMINNGMGIADVMAYTD
jgi:integrase